jgi:putative methionine-R-sulfoxide reductase with GAF domain
MPELNDEIRQTSTWKDSFDSNHLNKKSFYDLLSDIRELKTEKLEEYFEAILTGLAKVKEIAQAAVYLFDKEENPEVMRFLTGYACHSDLTKELTFEEGEGFPGQAIADKKILNIKNVPKGYITVKTGLGESSPTSLLIVPFADNDKAYGFMELASFHEFSNLDEAGLADISKIVVEKLEKEYKK